MRGLALLGLCVLVSPASLPCCGVTREEPLEFGGQLNLIVWDDDKKVQHFVRVAHFEGQVEKLGFVAPTPSVPKLAEVDAKVFETLYDTTGVHAVQASEGYDAGPASEVEVVQDVRVGIYRAKTLRADDKDALNAYLKEEGFQFSADGKEWLAHYVDKDWYLTSFTVVQQNAQLSTSAIAMSFAAEEPFNPAYVPPDNIGTRSKFRLYFVADREAISGHVGNDSIRPVLSEALDEAAHQINEDLKKSEIRVTPSMHITLFEQSFSPRWKEDLTFRFADSSEQKRAHAQASGVPAATIIAVGLAGLIIGGSIVLWLNAASKS
jgi:hypothetical protein